MQADAGRPGVLGDDNAGGRRLHVAHMDLQPVLRRYAPADLDILFLPGGIEGRAAAMHDALSKARIAKGGRQGADAVFHRLERHLRRLQLLAGKATGRAADQKHDCGDVLHLTLHLLPDRAPPKNWRGNEAVHGKVPITPCHNFGNKIPTGTLSAHRSMANRTRKEAQMLGTILLIILILLLIGALPNWGYSRSWGYGPSGGLGLIVVILLILVLMGRI